MAAIIMKEQKEKKAKTEIKQYNIKPENIKKMNIYLNKTKNGNNSNN